jgi:energy-coupling factor transporter transmembrane protein EcfT
MNPFSYQHAGGALSRLTATSKTIALALLSVAAMRAPAGAALLLAFAGLSGARFSAGALRGARGVLLLAIGAALARGLLPDLGAATAVEATAAAAAPGVFRLFDPATLGDSLAYAIRLLAVYFLGCAYYAGTLPWQLGDAATRLARRALRFAGIVNGFGRRSAHGAAPATGAPDPGIYLGLTLAFLPRAFERYRRTREAAALRGYGMADRRPGPLVAVLARFAYASVRDALLTSRAMELRCYDPARTIAPSPWCAADYILVALATLVAALTALSARSALF